VETIAEKNPSCRGRTVERAEMRRTTEREARRRTVEKKEAARRTVERGEARRRIPECVQRSDEETSREE
jgi:hypothetical protein